MTMSRGALPIAVLLCSLTGAYAEEDLAQWVEPRVGGAANGHTTVAASCPFGLVQAGPDTGNFHWDYCGGYRDGDRSLYGFSHTHISGTGCTDLGDLLILPVTGEPATNRVAVPFRKETEIAEPGHYAVVLADGTRCETAVTPHGAIWRFTYASEGAHHLLVDTQWGITGPGKMGTRVLKASVDTADRRRLSGSLDVTGWVDRTWHFVLETDRPRIALRNLPCAPTEKGPRGLLTYDLAAGETLTVRVALSAVSVDGARRNLAAEVSDRSLDEIRTAARREWNRCLSQMTVPQATKEEKTVFYTALYHLFLQPNLISDVGDEPFYSTFSLWDTFRAAQPLYTIVAQDQMPAMIESLLEQGRRTGFLPVWTLWGKDNQCMVGTHSVPVLVDWFLKLGSPANAYWRGAYAQVKETLTKPHPGRQKERWNLLDKYGYYPFDAVPHESVSRTLECAYDDACAARMARALGEADDAAFFARRAANWRNVFDPKAKLMRGRDSTGAWRAPFNPFALGQNDFTEGNSYQYTWHVMQDPRGLIAAFGGAAEFAARLDGLFTLPEQVAGMGVTLDVSGLIGQYAHGNEPSHHTIYFFPFVNRRDRTAELVRQVFDQFYRPGPDGLCGNEDCGQMSAWYLFSAMGLYPFDPCGGEYVLGAPQFGEIRVKTGGGKTFVVRANGLSRAAKYVRSVRLNGREVSGLAIRHGDIVSGGELCFEMSAEPSARRDNKEK